MIPLNDQIKVIFFDAGGVLFDTIVKGDERIRNLLIERGYTLTDINRAIKKAKEVKLNFITTWDEEEEYYKRYYGTIAQELGEKELTNELLFFTHFAAHCELFTEVEDVLNELRKKYRLAVISNAMPSMDWIFDRLRIRKYFDSIILSAFEKVEKPGEEIYYAALNKLKVSSEESIFIDDIIENVVGAQRIGIRGIHLDRSKTDLLNILTIHKLL